MSEGHMFETRDGKVFHADGTPIDRPAVMFDSEIGVLLKAGDMADLEEGFERFARSMKGGFILLDLAKAGFRPDEACALMNRVIECSDSDFLIGLARACADGSPRRYAMRRINKGEKR